MAAGSGSVELRSRPPAVVGGPRPLPSMLHAGEQVNGRAPAGPLSSNMAPSPCHMGPWTLALMQMHGLEKWLLLLFGNLDSDRLAVAFFRGRLSQIDAPVNHFGR